MVVVGAIGWLWFTGGGCGGAKERAGQAAAGGCGTLREGGVVVVVVEGLGWHASLAVVTPLLLVVVVEASSRCVCVC